MIAFTTQTKLLAGLLLTLGLTVGCQQQTSTESADGHGHGHEHGHDHHHGRPATLHEAVAALEHIRDEVKTAMESGSPDAAHHPLHEVGELLEVLPEIAADTDLPREKWEEAKAETDKLFDAFGTIDEAFHTAGGDKVAAYEQVAADIDESIEKLEALLPMTGEKPPAEGSGGHHDDHDHDGDHAHEHDHSHGHDHAHSGDKKHAHEHEHHHEHGHDHKDGEEHNHDHEEHEGADHDHEHADGAGSTSKSEG